MNGADAKSSEQGPLRQWVPPLRYGNGTWDFMHVPLKPIEPRQPSLDDILAAVAWHYDVPVHHLRCDRKALDLLQPRQVFYFLAREMTSKSLPVIGRYFGRDHASVLQGANTLRSRLRTDAALFGRVGAIRAHIRDVVDSRKPARAA
jgi:chromosomal replication initiation ATPase DnaA